MNINDIAQLAGVSPSTVSKVMNGRDESISSETRRRVLEVAKRHHYQPRSSACQQGGRSLMLGVLVRDAAHEGQLIAGMLKAAAQEGYSLVLEEGGTTAEGELRAMAALTSRHVDGIIWSTLVGEGSRAKGELEASSIPSVEYGTGADGGLGIDYELIGYRATKALTDAGHVDIACVVGDESCDELFAAGYRRCLFECGLPAQDKLVITDAGDTLKKEFDAWRYTAVVASRYLLAARLCEIAAASHYDVPADLSIVAAFTPGTGEGTSPICSTIRVPLREMGEALVRRMVAVVEGRVVDDLPQLPYELDSCMSISAPSCSKRARVISLGSINVDNYLSFDTLPRVGTSSSTSRSSVFPGGKCTNEAVGVARLGHAVTAIGRVGDDADADLIFSVLSQSGVDASGIRRVEGCRTGQAYIFVDKTGDSMISIMSGANGHMTAEGVCEHRDLFDDASACLLQTEVPLDAVMEAASMARECGVLTVMKPSACGVLPGSLLACIDVLVPNLNELDLISPDGKTMDEKVQRLLDAGVGLAVVTMGEAGCAVYEGGQRTDIEALDVTSVDDTGAGDAFISAFVSYVLRGFGVVRSARIATYAASLSVTRQGVTPALVDRETLEAFILQADPELLS